MEPQDREEAYLANAAGDEVTLPACPWNRKEAYLADIGDRLDGIDQEIQDLENNPDVTDIVDTYADLMAYDTSTLTDKDIIRVLNDETHNDESTYYRYSKATDTWTYIGSTGPKGGVQSDWEEDNSEDPAYIKNRPFYSEGVESELEQFNSTDSGATPETGYNWRIEKVEGYELSEVLTDFEDGDTIRMTLVYSVNGVEKTDGSTFTLTIDGDDYSLDYDVAPGTRWTGAYASEIGDGTTFRWPVSTADSGGTIYLVSATYERIKQLDAKYIPVDGDTVRVNADGELEANVQGGPTVVQTTGTSTTDVMSQNAVTEALASAGGIKTLTSDDFNYNYNTGDVDSPNCIAAWLLPAGVYKIGIACQVSTMHFVGVPGALTYYMEVGSILVRQGLPEVHDQGPAFHDYSGSTLILSDDGDNRHRAYYFPANTASQSLKTIFGETKYITANMPISDFAIAEKFDGLAQDAVFRAATSSLAGDKGLVPAPAVGKQNAYLKGNGTWADWSQPDWEQNDSSENSYILHRPFYEDTVEQKQIYSSLVSTSEPADWFSFDQSVRDLFENNYGISWLGCRAFVVLDSSGGQDMLTAMQNDTPIALDDVTGTMRDWETEQEITYIMHTSAGTFIQDNDYTGGEVWVAPITMSYTTDNWVTTNTTSGFLMYGPGSLLAPDHPNYANSYIVIPMSELPYDWPQSYTAAQNVLYSSSIVTQTKQLDSKFIKVDGNTISVNSNGELEASGSGPTVVQTTGTSQTDVMSQNATSGMVYTSSGTGIRIGYGIAGTNHGIAIGYSTSTNGANNGIAIGEAADARGFNVAIGSSAKAPGSSAMGVSIGRSAGANTSSSIKGYVNLGSHSSATNTGEVNIGTSDTTEGYNSSNYRLLTGLYDGQSAHDAATVGQLKMGVLSTTPTGTTVGFPGRLYTLDTGGGVYEVYLCVHDNGDNTYVWKQVSLI